jgi:DNA-directed RNA polymerase beta' subunit
MINIITIFAEHDTPSTTALIIIIITRVSVHNDNLASLSGLKVQSSPRPYGLINKGKPWVQSDEMNIFCPQSIQAQIELEQIADVKLQIITPQSSAPIIGIVQDGLLGSYNLTIDSEIIDWRSTMNMLASTDIEDLGKFKKNRTYTGKEVYSNIIPKKINLHKQDGDRVIINVKNGEITQGNLDVHSIGVKKKNNLIQLVWDEYGVEETRKFIDNTTRLSNNFNLYHGFSVGIGDLDITTELYKKMYQIFETKKLEVRHEITEVENNPDMMDEELFERSIKQKLDVIRDDISKLIMNNLKPTNNFKIMIESGSKGKPIQMGQMGGCVGQQDFQGGRILKNYNNRSLAYFFKNDDRAESRGFVERSFLKGLNLTEFIFHHLTSREGLIDQTVKSVTGDTMIIVNESNNIKCIKIGDLIDKYLDNHKENIKHYSDKNMELLEINNGLLIPTVDEVGNVSWGAITALTRHDPGNELYEVITESGRSVKVPESKSLLIWDELSNQFNQIETPNVKIGDKVPATLKFPKNNMVMDVISIDDLNNNYTFETVEELYMFNMKLNMNNIFASINIDAKTLTIVNSYVSHNDVVLDKIIKINKISNDYPKLYDLTVPSTSNFIIGCGMGVYDTAESGYIQRKLVKSTEDFMIKYDGTVRNAVERIQQFIYGDSGIDTVRQYDYKFKIMEMSNSEIADKFKFSKDELKKLKDYSEKDNDEYYKNILKMRDHLRQTQIKASVNYLALNISYMLPVNINRIIDNTKNNQDPNHQVINDPTYIIKKLEYILQNDKCRLYSMTEDEIKNPKSVKNIDDLLSKTTFRYALYDAFAPKKCINYYKLSKKQLDEMAVQIITSFNKAVVEPGEMVGIIGAQSIGEPVTQMMLNSIDWTDKVIIRNSSNNDIIDSHLPIGKFIDKLIEDSKSSVQFGGDNLDNNMKDIYYLDIKDKNYSIQSVNPNGKISWKLIEAVTKHLPINKDGSNTLIKVTTKSGKCVTATKGKSFLTQHDNKIIPTRGDDIKVGDLLPVMIDNYDNNTWDIFPSVKLNTNTQTSFKRWELVKILDNLLKLNSLVNKPTDLISQKLLIDENIITELLNSDVYYDEIVSIEEVQPTNTYVYDFTVADTKNFNIANGLCMRDSFHNSGVGGMGGANLGVPRIKEVLSLSKNPKEPVMVIYLDKDHRGKKDYANKIASYIKFTTISDLRNKIEIFYDPNPYQSGGFMEKDNVYNIFYAFQQSKTACQNKVDGLSWLMRIEFDKEKLLTKEVSLLDIKSQFCNNWEKRYQDIKSLKREKRQVLEKINQIAILTNTDNDNVPIMHIRFDMTNFNSSTLVDFMDMFVDDFKLKGMSDIDEIRGGSATEERMISFDNPDQSFDNKFNEYVIYTKGVNMIAVRNIIGVDLNRTYCNDIITTYEMFGVEAARNLIIREIVSVFACNGSAVNYQHISIFGDLMTNVGTLTSIDRHGLNKLDTDPFSRASFEKTVEQLITAAIFNEVDHMKSVSSRIMAGLCIKGGTGLCNLILDKELLENSEYTTDIGQLYNKTYEDIIPIQTKHEVDTDIFIPELN